MEAKKYDERLNELLEKYPQFKDLNSKIEALQTGDRIRAVCFITLMQAAKMKPEINYHSDVISKVMECCRQATIADTLLLLLKSPLNDDQMQTAILKCQENVNTIKPQIALLVENMTREESK